jgi:hypothetical protein
MRRFGFLLIDRGILLVFLAAWVASCALVVEWFLPGTVGRLVPGNDSRTRAALAADEAAVAAPFDAQAAPASAARDDSDLAVRQRAALSHLEASGGVFYTANPADPYQAPELVSIAIPDFAGTYSIWGATGRDNRGHIWFGVSATTQGTATPSAHLFEYLPESARVIARSDVVSQLKVTGRWRAGESQMKIHSKIVAGSDGHLYFTSMDEQGEDESGGRLPTWGSHLWRVRPSDGRWEHLLAAPEGLIALSGMGTRFYALGYFGHRVYQYDAATRSTRFVDVGSLGGHISRNFLSDDRGHVYVPRLKASAGSPSGIGATLVELDSGLRERGETPLAHYLDSTPLDSHGITGYQSLADRSIVFVTSAGYLYRVAPRGDSPAEVRPLGWFHPEGPAYTASLFAYDGRRYVVGASRRRGAGSSRYEWVVYDLAARRSIASPMEIPRVVGLPAADLMLYGSVTRDNWGNFYLGGTFRRAARELPALFQARLPR